MASSGLLSPAPLPYDPIPPHVRRMLDQAELYRRIMEPYAYMQRVLAQLEQVRRMMEPYAEMQRTMRLRFDGVNRQLLDAPRRAESLERAEAKHAEPDPARPAEVRRSHAGPHFDARDPEGNYVAWFEYEYGRPFGVDHDLEPDAVLDLAFTRWSRLGLEAYFAKQHWFAMVHAADKRRRE